MLMANTNGIKITHAPLKEIVVHEYISVPMEDLLRSRVTPAGTMPLYWCGGLVFTFSSMPWTRDIVRDYMEGKIHWLEVQFAVMDKYKPVLEVKDESYPQAQRVRVIDTSASTLHTELSKWLKGQNKLR
jgi:hypothetical protein